MKKSIWFLAASAALAACGDPCDEPNAICTLAGTGDPGKRGDNGPATDAELYAPQDTAIAPNGEVWVLDFNTYRVRSIDASGTIKTVVGNGVLGDSPEPGLTQVPAIAAAMNHTSDLFFHDGYLYLSAWHNSRIKRVRLSDMMIENYAGVGRRTYYDGDGGPALGASLDLPSSIALDPNNNIVIMDQANQVVRKVDAQNVITTIVGSCIVEDTACAPGEQPRQCDGSSKLACGSNLLAECMKACTPGFGGDNGPALTSRMAQPFGQAADPAGRLTYDTAGNLIIADTENHRIRKIDPAGIITTLAGTGNDSYSGDGGPAIQADINRPIDVEVGPDNSVYFTDTFNSCIRKIDPAGIISTVVGKCSPNPADRGFSGDGGPADEAQLNRPYGIDLAGDKLYVTDSYNHRIRVVNL